MDKKNNAGGAAHLKVANKIIQQHSNPSLGSRCHVRLLGLYKSKLPAGFSENAFFYRPLSHSSSFGPWYSKQVYGHNKPQSALKQMCSEAGIAVRSNHALRGTAATRIFQSVVPVHLIQEPSSHRSRKPSENTRRLQTNRKLRSA